MEGQESDDLERSWKPRAAPEPAAADQVGTGPSGSVTVPAPARNRHRASRRRASGPLSWLRETAIVAGSALILSTLVKTFLLQSFWIPSPSMHDTLLEHDRIVVSKLTPGLFQIHRGDIVVFRDPGGWLSEHQADSATGFRRGLGDVLTFVGLRPGGDDQHLVKRVIGVAGDRVACAGDGSPVTVNGVPVTEPYLAPGAGPSSVAFDVTVPAHSVWVMGDNRGQSRDSRYHQSDPGGGSVPVADVVGVAFVLVWPVDRWTLLRNPGATFADVPDPPAE